MESNRTRYEKIGSQIDETLGDDEVGLRGPIRRTKCRFAAGPLEDIEVLYVSPPGQADFQTWLHQWMLQQQAAAAGESQDQE